MRASLSLLAVAAAWVGTPGRCAGATATVPDDYATIQLAIDSGPDTIVVRAGTYSESPTLRPYVSSVVLMADPAASPRPTLQGLTVYINHTYEGDAMVVGLRVVNQVSIRPGTVSSSFIFESCLFEAGLWHGGLPVDYSHAGRRTTFARCLMRGATNLTVGELVMEADTVEAGGVTFSPTSPARVSTCLFRDSPIGLRIYNRSGDAYDEVVENVVENCPTGLLVIDTDNMARVHIQKNIVRNCRDWGIRVVRAEYVAVLDNDVRQCGVGISTENQYWSSRVNGNTVIGGTGHGIEIADPAWELELLDNTVLKNSGSGIRVVAQIYDDLACSIAGNTSALNGGPGLDLSFDNNYQRSFTCVVSNNIGHANGGVGLKWTLSGGGSLTPGCNDWFANTGGSTSGVASGATDLSVDPLFCDLPGNDVRLRSDSPLLGGACGTIGAHGIGCDAATEVLVALFAAEASDEGVRIRWRLGGDEQPLSAWMERSHGELGPWQAIATERVMDGAVTVDWDRTAEPGRRYWYRLAWTTADGATNYSSPTVIDLASLASSLALRVIGPNPTNGPVAIEYVLPRAGAIELTIHDLMGREVARLVSGTQSKGLHATQWAGNIRGGRARPGVYFVRLSTPVGQESRRILLRQ